MKKIILTMLAGMMALGAMAQDDVFTVMGTFEGREDSVSFILINPETEKILSQRTFVVTGNMLKQSYKLPNAAMLYVMDRNNGYKGHMSVPAIPGETVEFYKNDGNITHLRGSQFYVDYNEAEQSIEAPMIELMNFVGECNHKYSTGVPEDQIEKEYNEKYPVYYKNYMDALTGYIKAHPDQDASAALLTTIAETQSESVIEDIESAASLLTERARNGVAANLYKKILASAKKEAEEKALQYSLEGQPAPDFTLNDINGKPLALSSLRGKWVVIDFWGSWCGWCIKGMPKMKEYYTKYDGKLEILGVDCNDTVEKWKAAVAKHELPWLHVYYDMDDEKNDVMSMYNVRGFPTKVIVDPKGNVAKIIVGEDPEFYKFLDEAIK